MATRSTLLLAAFSSLVLTVMAVAAPAPTRRPARPVDEGLKLVLRLDRGEYLEHEPILAEWGLLNTSRHVLTLPGWARFGGTYEWRQGEGNWVPLRMLGRRCGTGVPDRCDLPAKQAWWGRTGLRESFAGLPTTGKFSVRAVMWTRIYLGNTNEDPIEVTLVSDEITVESKR